MTLLKSTNFSATALDDNHDQSDDIQQSLDPLLDIFKRLVIGTFLSLVVLLVELINFRLYRNSERTVRKKLRLRNGQLRFR